MSSHDSKEAALCDDHAEEDPESLLRELEVARAKVAALEMRYASSLCRPLVRSNADRPVRIFVDGAFDLMHFGHMNAFRQARALGDVLVVGVNSSESIELCKGSAPVLSDAERQEAISACRFVDEIVPASPYIMTAEYIQELMSTKHIDYFVHGDDPCIVDGKDVYEAAKKAGRYRSIPRTEGISTTEIVGRLLTLTNEHHTVCSSDVIRPSPQDISIGHTFASASSKFLVTSELMSAFKGPRPKPREGQRIIYVDGSWDMFHAGHTSFLQKAHELGDFLLVGVHSDATVNEFMGTNHPIMNMQERMLSVLGCRYVDDVLIDAPWHITTEMIKTLGVAQVASGTVRDHCVSMFGDDASEDPHFVPKQMGIHVELESSTDLRVETIVNRLQARRTETEARFKLKQKKEQDWYNEKHGIV